MKSEEVRAILIANVGQPLQTQRLDLSHEASGAYNFTDILSTKTADTVIPVSAPKVTKALVPKNTVVARAVETPLDESQPPRQDISTRYVEECEAPSEHRRPPDRSSAVGSIEKHNASANSKVSCSASLWASKWAPKPDEHDQTEHLAAQAMTTLTLTTPITSTMMNAKYSGSIQSLPPRDLDRQSNASSTSSVKTRRRESGQAESTGEHVSTIPTRLEKGSECAEVWKALRLEPKVAATGEMVSMNTGPEKVHNIVVRELCLLAREKELLVREKGLLAREKELFALAQSTTRESSGSQEASAEEDRRNIE